jgi:hypothetical protein
MDTKKDDNIEYINNTNNILRFSISIPSDWKVSTDGSEVELWISEEEANEVFRQTLPDSSMTLDEFKKQATELLGEKKVSAEEAYGNLFESERAKAIELNEFKKIYERDKKEGYKAFFEKLLVMPPDEMIEGFAAKEISAEEAHTNLMAKPETFLIGFEEFKELYELEQEQQREAERRRDELAQMEVGYFEASPANDEDYPCVEVTKLKLTRVMSPLELYQLDKPIPEVVPWGNRPSKGITVDNLQGVKYYYVFDTGETRNLAEMPRFFNIYLTEIDTGWIISCSCRTGAFPKYKGIFTTIVGSFRRI